MQFDEIRVFVAVVEAGSFVGAARRLGAPPSTVSARVMALERRLGVTLMQRTTRKLRITEAGRSYFDVCRTALRQVLSAEERLADTEKLETGTLRLTAAVDIAQCVLPPLIASYRSAYPRISVDLVVADRMVDMIAEGIDLALRPGPLRESNLITRAFLKGPTGLFASPAYLKRKGVPRTVGDLASHEVVGFSRMPGKLEMMRSGRKVALPVQGMVTCDDILTVRALLERDVGIGLLPGIIAADASRPLVRVLPELSHRVSGLYFAYPAQRYVPQRVRTFIDHALSVTRSARGR
ncbi:MAG: LysR family transcriptional regulator [Rhizobiaceae bacterium]|nr:LysR family transcriptional regulator [Rhizobiaceae bacterium]